MAANSNTQKSDSKDQDLIKFIMDCRNEADDAKQDRMRFNKDNYAMYQMKHDFSHKAEGQSVEILAKQRMAVEQTKSFFQQALADLGEWFRVVPRDKDTAENVLPIKPHEVQKMLAFMHEQNSYFSHVGNSIQSGLLGALIITKADGELIDKPKFVVKRAGRKASFKKSVEKIDSKTWQLCPKIVRQEDFYPDPTNRKLYEIEEMWVDLHTVKQLSRGDDAIYDPKQVSQISTTSYEDTVHENEKNMETGQNTTRTGHRPQVKLTEFWGTVIDGEGEVLHENVVVTIANDTTIIRKPTPNPLWHQKSPYTVAPILEVANAVWPIALMDAPTQHNRTLIELYNLILDAAFKKVHAISQIRINDLADLSQVSDGIKPGTKLQVKSSLPPGVKVMEKVEDADIPADAISVLNIEQQEFNASALTNDLRQGVMPFRQVKATEVVEASQSITSMFQGIAKNIESKYIEPELELHAYTLAQNWDRIDKAVFVSNFGVQRGTELSQLDSQDVFVAIVSGYKFDVFGVSRTLNKVQDFRKFTTLLQTIGSSDVLIEEFLKKYDFGKLLGEVMTALDIDKAKIENEQAEPMAQGGAPAPGTGPNQDFASTPAAPEPGLADAFGGGPTPFPGSPATAGQGGAQ